MNTVGLVGARYSRGAIVFHWTIAVLIALNFAAAWIADDMPRQDKQIIMGNHKAIGITILVLAVLRVIWRLTHRPPPRVETLQRWEVLLAKVVHTAFYVLMIAIPLAGWAMSSIAARPVNFFGLFTVPMLPLGSDKAVGGVFHDLHEQGATLMLVLLALHVAGALKHHFIDRDGTMRRMLPGAAATN